MIKSATIEASPSARLDDFNGLMYVISRAISNKVNTIELVKVVAVREDGKIDVIKALDNVNTDGERIPSVVIPNMNVWRSQSGTNAIIIDPKVGDIGVLLVCKHDISGFAGGVVINDSEFSYGDGIYLGGVLGFNQAPTEKIEFTDTGISITSTKDLSINAKNVNITAQEKAIVNAPSVDVNATTEIKLGTNAVKQIARVGDNVVSGTTVIGQIQANDSIVRSL